MTEEERRQLLDNARQLEARERPDLAVQAYAKAGAVDETARLLMALRRYEDASRILLESAGIRVAGSTFDQRAVDALTPEARQRAMKAAICYARVNNLDAAVNLFLALGEVTRAVDLLQKSGDSARAARVMADFKKRTATPSFAAAGSQPVATKGTTNVTIDVAKKLEAEGKFQLAMETYLQLKQLGSAARMARMSDRTLQAADLFSDGGMPFEAALCFLEGGDTGKALDQFIRVPRDDPRYRESAIHAINLAVETNYLDFNLENFLGFFLRDTPRSEREAEAFHNLAKLYIKRDFIENARDACTKILKVYPNFPGVRERLDQMEDENHGSAMVYEKILKDDVAFRKVDAPTKKRPGYIPAAGGDLPDLPELPDLPPLPTAPSRPPAGPRPQAASSRPPAAAPAATVASPRAPSYATQAPARPAIDRVSPTAFG